MQYYVRFVNFFHNYTDYLGMLKNGVKAVLEDKGFQLPSPAAYAAASKMNDWLATNGDFATPLAQELVVQLSNCVNSKREMWGIFHETRNSTKFVSLWRNLMQTAIDRMATPIFFQFVTDVMFNQLIKCHFPLNSDKRQAEKNEALTYEESNALR